MTIELRSDNAAGVAPEIMAAVLAADHGSALAYGGDALTDQLQHVVREVFEHPEAQVFPVTSGTAANALALSAVCPPWGAVLCHHVAHVLTNECGSTSLLGGGAVVRGIDGDARSLVTPDSLRAALDGVRWGDPHHSQPMALTLTQASEVGTIYTTGQIAALTEIARERSMRVHIDGARIANAVAALGCSPADVTWRSGVDVLSLGATKNGALSAEAIVAFDESAAEELVYRTKRSGHVTSKMRFQAAQLTAYLTDGLWLRLAAHSNRQMARLAAGLSDLGMAAIHAPDANLMFLEIDDAAADVLEARGLLFYRTAPGTIRLVTSWQTTDDEIDAALAAFASV